MVLRPSQGRWQETCPLWNPGKQHHWSTPPGTTMREKKGKESTQKVHMAVGSSLYCVWEAMSGSREAEDPGHLTVVVREYSSRCYEPHWCWRPDPDPVLWHSLNLLGFLLVDNDSHQGVWDGWAFAAALQSCHEIMMKAKNKQIKGSDSVLSHPLWL